MAHCRSARFARDDNKERVVASRVRLSRTRRLQGKSGCKERVAARIEWLQGKGRCKERVVAEPRHVSNLIWTGLHPLRTALKTQVAQPRVVVGAPSAWPVKLALRLFDRQVIDAGVPRIHQTLGVKFPILIAVSTKPTSRVVVIFIGKANRDAIAGECPQLLDQPVVEFSVSTSAEEGNDLLSPVDELGAVSPT